MFQNACKAMAVTMVPIILLYKDDKDKVGYSIGAGLVLNEGGWMLTAVRITSDPSKPSWNDPFPRTAQASRAAKVGSGKSAASTKKASSKRGSAQRRTAS